MVTYSFPILGYVGIINYIPKLQHGCLYSKKSCIFKWFTLDCHGCLKEGSSCLVHHQREELQMKTLEDAGRKKQGGQFPNWYQM